MRPSVFGYLVIGVAALMLSAPVFAHHSFMKEYDMNKPITLKGVINKVEWSNPHINFWIDVTDEKGQITRWGLESASVTALSLRGFTRDSLKIGETVTVEAFSARDGKAFGATKSIILADGRIMNAASDGVPSRPRTAK